MPLRMVSTVSMPICRREVGMRREMHRLAMDRHGDLRPEPAIHLAKLVAARMAGDVDQRVAVGDDADAARRSAR